MTERYSAWIGREESRDEPILPSVTQAMAATLDLPAPAADGSLPPGWRWVWLNPVVRRSGLGTDGHPLRGGFLPPIELPRRMWAGSRLRYVATLPIGATATKVSRIASVTEKVGKLGSLWFVTVSHTISSGGGVCIEEEQDIVYRSAPAPGASLVPVERYPKVGQWTRDVQPDSTLLFRYSALTFNGHRIHYDQNYARHEEGYRDLVVHGPLTATMLQQFALEQSDGRALIRFDFRGVSPLFADRPFRLEMSPNEDGTLACWARGPDGELAMSAIAAFG